MGKFKVEHKAIIHKLFDANKDAVKFINQLKDVGIDVSHNKFLIITSPSSIFMELYVQTIDRADLGAEAWIDFLNIESFEKFWFKWGKFYGC